MTVNIENEYEGSRKLLSDDRIEGFLSSGEYTDTANAVIRAALEHEDCPYEADVSLLLTDDEAIREMNAEYRDLDRSTDVLSFPMVDYEAPACFDGFDEEEDLFDPDSGELMLGDIVISVDHCIDQAKEYGHSVRREFAFLVAHSMLHLLGYDHMTEEDSAEMERRQEAILSGLGITRD